MAPNVELPTAARDSFSPRQHRTALLRRRIKFIVEKGSMARLFKAGTNRGLQEELFRGLDLEILSAIESQEEYDGWLCNLVRCDCWERYSRNGLAQDRWAYFAKLLNIAIYEILSNREVLPDAVWQRIRFFLHIPLDSSVFFSLLKLDASFPACWVLKGMTEQHYWEMQIATRKMAAQFGVPPIWLEDAWSS